MRIAVLGGGPAGLYFAYLWKRRHPQSEVTLYEQNPADATNVVNLAGREAGVKAGKDELAVIAQVLVNIATSVVMYEVGATSMELPARPAQRRQTGLGQPSLGVLGEWRQSQSGRRELVL